MHGFIIQRFTLSLYLGAGYPRNLTKGKMNSIISGVESGGIMVATRIGCMDVMLLYFARGKPTTEEGKALFENHRKQCMCVQDILDLTGEPKEPLALFTGDRAVLLRDFGPCDFPEVKQDPVDLGLIEILAFLSKRGKV